MNRMPDWLFVLLIVGGLAVFFFLISIWMIVFWRRIARVYPDGPQVAERIYRGVRGQFGVQAWYGDRFGKPNVPPLHLTLGKQGMGISLSFLFRRLCPPVFIPWSAIHTLRGRVGNVFGCDMLHMEVSRISTALRFEFLWRHGDAISVIQKYWEENRAILPEKTTFQSNPA